MDERREPEGRQFDLRALDSPMDIRSAMLTGLFILAVLYTLYFARAVLLPIAVATLLATLLSPIVTWQSSRLRLPMWACSMMTLLVVLIVVVAAGLYLATPAANWARSLPEDIKEAQYKLRDIMAPVERLREASEQVEEEMAPSDNGEQESVPVRVQEPGLMEAALNWAPRTLVAGGLTLALLYFLLAAGNLFVYKLVRIVPTLSDKKRAVEIVHSIKEEISRYMLTITLINIGLGVAVTVVMWALGMPNPLLWGAMATTFNFVPYLGAVVGLALISLVALVTFDQMSHTLLVAGSYAALTAIEGNIVTPSILGRRLPLNAVVVFIGLIFWAWIWGIPGAFLAVPIMAAVKIICDRVEQLTPVGEFLGR